MYEIVVGRSESDRKKLGLTGTVFIGKHYVKMGAITSLSNKVYMDISRAHVVFICGKRGSGKSYTLGAIAEDMANLPTEINRRLAVLIFDTMGIFWTMRFKNVKDEDLLREWDLPQKTLDVIIYTPAGFYDDYKQKGIPTDFKFTIRPNELMASDWISVFGLDVADLVSVAIELALLELEGENYSIEDIINKIKESKRLDEKTKLAAENRFVAVRRWGLFSSEGTPINEIIAGGKVTILDVSCYQDWNVKNLVIGLISRKLMIERMASRKKEELSDIESGHSYFSQFRTETKDEMPMVWIMIDEAHECLPKEGKTPATDALVQLLREGRQPGISLILVTQQPGEIHKDVTTQSDIVICHRITARKDIDALNSMMQSYSGADIMKYLNSLPRLLGSAIVLDDNSERMYPIRVRPRFTWHGGEAPVAVKAKGSAVEELGL